MYGSQTKRKACFVERLTGLVSPYHPNPCPIGDYTDPNLLRRIVEADAISRFGDVRIGRCQNCGKWTPHCERLCSGMVKITHTAKE